MRLRKKNVSRVAAVAVAAVMAVSAAAPAAVAAAPVANGDTAVVQENGDRRINITYINEEDNSNIGATSVWVGATEEYLSTSLLTDVPNGFTVAPSCPTIAVGPQLGEEPFVTVYCVPATPAATEHDIVVTYKNNDTGAVLDSETVTVSNSAEQLTADMLKNVPANWTVYSASLPQNINSETTSVDVYCVPAVSEHDIVVTYRDNDTNKELGKETVTVSNSAEQLTADMLKAVPANWTVYSASVPQNINSETTSVDVYCVPAVSEHDIVVTYRDNDTNKELGKETVTVSNSAEQLTADMLKAVPANWTVYSASVPQNITSETASVDVYCVPATHKVTVEYRNADNWDTVVGREVIEVADNADYVGINVLKKIPTGWAVTADTTQIAVGNKMATTTVAVTKVARKFTVEYRDVDNWNTVVGTEVIEVAGDADYVGTDVLTEVPTGWTVTADTTQVAVGEGVTTTAVAVTKAARKVTVEYRDADNWDTVVGTEVIEVAGDADYVGTDVLTEVPAGWAVTADTTQVAVGVDTTAVAVTKAARKVTVEYRDADSWETVVGTEVIEVAGNADYVGTDVLTKVPAGWTVTADTTQIAVGVETTTVAVTKVTTPDPVDPTPTPDPEPTPAPTVNPVTTALGVGAWLLALGGLILGFFGL